MSLSKINESVAVGMPVFSHFLSLGDGVSAYIVTKKGQNVKMLTGLTG
jgi:hypothetical protein